MGIIQPNIELYLPFEITLPSLGTDASGNGNHGTVYGVTQGVGKIGGAGVFDGVNDYINGGTSLNSIFSGSFTLLSWILFNDLTRVQYIINNYDDGIKDMSILIIGSNIRFSIADATTRIFIEVPISTFDLSKFYHFAFIRDRANLKLKLLINGQPYSEINDTLNEDITSANPLLLGVRRISGQTYSFNGSLSKLKIFSTALSEQNIRREMISLPSII